MQSRGGELNKNASYLENETNKIISILLNFFSPKLHKNKHFSDPVHTFDDDMIEKLKLKYYNSDLHRSAFILPTFCRDVSCCVFSFNYIILNSYF